MIPSAPFLLNALDSRNTCLLLSLRILAACAIVIRLSRTYVIISKRLRYSLLIEMYPFICTTPLSGTFLITSGYQKWPKGDFLKKRLHKIFLNRK